HQEKTPSCSLTRGPDGTLRVRCFGPCDLAGDVFDLVAAVEGLDRDRDFADVVRRAAEIARIDASEVHAHRRPRPPPDPPRLDHAISAAIVAPLLHVGRLDAESSISSDVCAYLEERGLLDAARADGWAALPCPECQSTWTQMLLDAAQPIPGHTPPFTAGDV